MPHNKELLVRRIAAQMQAEHYRPLVEAGLEACRQAGLKPAAELKHDIVHAMFATLRSLGEQKAA